MNLQKRNTLIVANWKMHKTVNEASQFVLELAPHVKSSLPEICLAVPFTALHAVAVLCQGTKIKVGAQNMNEHEEGAYTGEISAEMILEARAQFVILGHSERRKLFHENDETVNKKLKKALEKGLKPILCFGETAAEREKGDTEKALGSQLGSSLADLSAEQIDHLTLAYEPIWAIGTNHTAMPEVAQEVHSFCRNFLARKYGPSCSEKVRILYGGSVKPQNAAKLMEQKDIDGLLVGTASLSVESFEKIVNFNYLTEWI